MTVIAPYKIVFYRKYIEVLNGKPEEYYEGDRRLPIFAKIPGSKKRLLSAEETIRCILHPGYQGKHICSKAPTAVNHNVMFLVDTSKLEDPADVVCDDLGVWQNNRVDTLHFIVKRDQHMVGEVKKLSGKNRNAAMYTMKRVYRTHGTDKTFRKVTASVTGKYMKCNNMSI
jgi:hypothetical protein